MAACKTDTSSPAAAFAKAQLLIGVRERSEKELSARLVKAGFGKEAVDDAIDKCKRYGYLNNDRFAEMYLMSKTQARWGSLRIRRELARHGIDLDSVPAAQQVLAEPQEYARALDVLRRKPSHAKNLYLSYVRRLLNKGYPAAIACRAVHDHLAEVADNR